MFAIKNLDATIWRMSIALGLNPSDATPSLNRQQQHARFFLLFVFFFNSASIHPLSIVSVTHPFDEIDVMPLHRHLQRIRQRLV